MKTKLKKLLSLLLAVILCAGMVPAQAFAAGGVPVRLPETEVEAEILASDVFILPRPPHSSRRGTAKPICCASPEAETRKAPPPSASASRT